MYTPYAPHTYRPSPPTNVLAPPPLLTHTHTPSPSSANVYIHPPSPLYTHPPPPPTNVYPPSHTTSLPQPNKYMHPPLHTYTPPSPPRNVYTPPLYTHTPPSSCATRIYTPTPHPQTQYTPPLTHTSSLLPHRTKVYTTPPYRTHTPSLLLQCKRIYTPHSTPTNVYTALLPPLHTHTTLPLPTHKRYIHPPHSSTVSLSLPPQTKYASLLPTYNPPHLSTHIRAPARPLQCYTPHSTPTQRIYILLSHLSPPHPPTSTYKRIYHPSSTHSYSSSRPPPAKKARPSLPPSIQTNIPLVLPHPQRRLSPSTTFTGTHLPPQPTKRNIHRPPRSTDHTLTLPYPQTYITPPLPLQHTTFPRSPSIANTPYTPPRRHQHKRNIHRHCLSKQQHVRSLPQRAQTYIYTPTPSTHTPSPVPPPLATYTPPYLGCFFPRPARSPPFATLPTHALCFSPPTPPNKTTHAHRLSASTVCALRPLPTPLSDRDEKTRDIILPCITAFISSWCTQALALGCGLPNKHHIQQP
ncbi:hypothetical protein C7M84_002186 [Penaeus vannamei]|uniref:Uncharacterized protein n=1 Tax=Penaeus vannamei TaxID=6689 RepID=A0A3R7MCM8_PENVA|nr:hypothetical protein C7M84_002186 [Penaeus vannamei]